MKEITCDKCGIKEWNLLPFLVGLQGVYLCDKCRIELINLVRNWIRE